MTPPVSPSPDAGVNAREVIARAISQRARDMTQSYHAESPVKAARKYPTDALAIADVALAALAEAGIVLAKEQVGWMSGGGLFYTDAQHRMFTAGKKDRVPVYVPLTESELRGKDSDAR